MAIPSASRISGNKTVAPYSNGSTDFWLVKLRPDAVNFRALPQSPSDIRSQGFQLWLSGPSNTYVLDYSTDLAQWTPFHTNLLADNAASIVDSQATNATRRYYRVR